MTICNKKKKVMSATLIITTDLSKNGGISRFVKTLYKNICSDLLFFQNKKQMSTNEINADLIIPTYGWPPIYIFNIFILLNVLWKRKPQNIIINDPQVTTITMFLLILNIFMNKNLIFVSHGFLFHHNVTVFKRMYFWLSVKFLFKYMRIVCVSKSDSSKLTDFRFKGYQEILMGVPKQLVNSPFQSRDIDFVMVARDAPHKNIGSFIKYSTKRTTDKFLLVSDVKKSWLNQNLNLVGNLSDDELIEVYQNSKFFISFSSYEGFGLALLEALSNKCIPICVRNESFEFILGKNSKFFIDEFSVSSLDKKISELSAMSQDGLWEEIDSICEKFTEDAMLKCYRKMLEE